MSNLKVNGSLEFNSIAGEGLTALLDKIYPVGSIYLSTNSTSPESFLGGTWTKIKDRFLLASGDTYTSGKTGGEASHTLTTSEMPSHTHTFTGNAITGHTGVEVDTGSPSGAFSTGSSSIYKRTCNGTTGTRSDGYNCYFNATPSGTNSNTGGGQAHNNMPPYLVVNMWQRTA